MTSLKSLLILLILLIVLIFILGVLCYTYGYTNGYTNGANDIDDKIKSRFDYKSTLEYPHIVCTSPSPSVCDAVIPSEFRNDKYNWSIERRMESDMCYDVLIAKNNFNESIVWDFQECWEKGF